MRTDRGWGTLFPSLEYLIVLECNCAARTGWDFAGCQILFYQFHARATKAACPVVIEGGNTKQTRSQTGIHLWAQQQGKGDYAWKPRLKIIEGEILLRSRFVLEAETSPQLLG